MHISSLYDLSKPKVVKSAFIVDEVNNIHDCVNGKYFPVYTHPIVLLYTPISRDMPSLAS